MRTANKRRRYIVTSSIIGWAHTQNDPFIHINVINLQCCKLSACLVNHLVKVVTSDQYGETMQKAPNESHGAYLY